jgi:hypothetical protein
LPGKELEDDDRTVGEYRLPTASKVSVVRRPNREGVSAASGSSGSVASSSGSGRRGLAPAPAAGSSSVQPRPPGCGCHVCDTFPFYTCDALVNTVSLSDLLAFAASVGAPVHADMTFAQACEVVHGTVRAKRLTQLEFEGGDM